MTHLPLVLHMARKGKPMIISTGTALLSEVGETVQAMRSTGNDQIILMQCTAKYPAPFESLNVRTIPTMSTAFDLPVGLSDHSADPVIGPVAAVACGAVMLEKHFTFSKALPGPDHQFAVEPEELHALVRSVRQTEAALGSGVKEPHPVEQEIRAFARRSIFAIRPISSGETLSRENIAVLRCGMLGSDLPPSEYERLLGRVARRDIAAESLIRLGDLS